MAPRKSRRQELSSRGCAGRDDVLDGGAGISPRPREEPPMVADGVDPEVMRQFSQSSRFRSKPVSQLGRVRRVDDMTKQLSDANDTIRLIDNNAQAFADHCRKNGHESTAQWIEHHIIRRNPYPGV